MGREKKWTRSLTRGEKENPGCMGGMLHYLGFHQLLFSSCHGGTSTSNSGSGISSTNKEQLLLSSSSRVYHASKSQFKVLEAPRNSLELHDGKATMATMSTEEEFFDIPVGKQVTPLASSSASLKKSMMLALEEEKRSSSSLAETSRTPTVVARLMGLDVLPDQASSPDVCSPRMPTLMRKSKHRKFDNGQRKNQQLPQRRPLQSLNCNLAALPQLQTIDVNRSRSLPETPRASVSSTRSCDPRLSLQINKENTFNGAQAEFSYLYQVTGDYSLPTSPSVCGAAKLRRKHRHPSHQDEKNKSPRSQYYACEIVKQLKVTINNRRCGSNVGSNVGEIGVKLTKTSSAVEKKAECNGETAQNQIVPSVMKPKPGTTSPPPARLLEVHKGNYNEDSGLKRQLPPNYKEGSEGLNPPPTVPKKCRKASFERVTEKIKNQLPTKDNNDGRSGFPQSLPTSALTGKQIALHQKKKCVPNASIVTSRRKLKASASPSRPSPSPSPEHVTRVESSIFKPSSVQTTHKPTEQDPEYRYLKSMLEHIRVTGSSVAPCHSWHSSALLVDPVLFHLLELNLELREDDECRRRLGALRHRWNRKLLFHVVEEILVDLMLECSNHTSFHTLADHIVGHECRRSLHHLFSRGMNSCLWSDGEPLLQRQLWARIKSFPELDCRVVGDIDALAAGDLSSANTRRLLRHPSVVEEAEDVVSEVERELFDSLILETAASFVVVAPRGPSCLRWR